MINKLLFVASVTRLLTVTLPVEPVVMARVPVVLPVFKLRVVAVPPEGLKVIVCELVPVMLMAVEPVDPASTVVLLPDGDLIIRLAPLDGDMVTVEELALASRLVPPALYRFSCGVVTVTLRLAVIVYWFGISKTEVVPDVARAIVELAPEVRFSEPVPPPNATNVRL